jgi:hypothetical protein
VERRADAVDNDICLLAEPLLLHLPPT